MFRFIKVRDVKTPFRANNSDSGIDFFVPNTFDLVQIKITPTLFSGGEVENNYKYFDEITSDGKLYLLPGEGALIPSGIKCIIKEGFDLVFSDKSGVATKYGLIIGAKVVDSSYRGEIHLHLINTSNKVQAIDLGQKIAQGILRKVELDNPEEISEEEFYKEANTERGDGGFGSTGEK